jgi:hypothetical protein
MPSSEDQRTRNKMKENGARVRVLLIGKVTLIFLIRCGLWGQWE